MRNSRFGKILVDLGIYDEFDCTVSKGASRHIMDSHDAENLFDIIFEGGVDIKKSSMAEVELEVENDNSPKSKHYKLKISHLFLKTGKYDLTEYAEKIDRTYVYLNIECDELTTSDDGSADIFIHASFHAKEMYLNNATFKGRGGRVVIDTLMVSNSTNVSNTTIKKLHHTVGIGHDHNFTGCVIGDITKFKTHAYFKKCSIDFDGDSCTTPHGKRVIRLLNIHHFDDCNIFTITSFTKARIEIGARLDNCRVDFRRVRKIELEIEMTTNNTHNNLSCENRLHIDSNAEILLKSTMVSFIDFGSHKIRGDLGTYGTALVRANGCRFEGLKLQYVNIGINCELEKGMVLSNCGIWDLLGEGVNTFEGSLEIEEDFIFQDAIPAFEAFIGVLEMNYFLTGNYNHHYAIARNEILNRFGLDIPMKAVK